MGEVWYLFTLRHSERGHWPTEESLIALLMVERSSRRYAPQDDKYFERVKMSNFCEVCGKGPQFGKKVSHSHRRSPRRFDPNLQKIKVNHNGQIATIRVCASCLKAGKVTKA